MKLGGAWHIDVKQCSGSRRWENQAMNLAGTSTIIGGTAPKDVTCRTGNRMKQSRLILVAAGVWIWLAVGTTESGAAGVPYSQLTPQQKQAFALQVQRFGLTADQADKLLDADYLLKVELPGYRQCPFCKGTGASSYQTAQVKSTVRCSYCQGGGRIQRKVDPGYTYKDPSVQTFGTVQSANNYEFIDCPKCGGSGRMVVCACADCGGSGMVAAGPGQYVIGKGQKAGSATNSFDVLHLRNGKEIRRVQVAKIAGDDAELRHSAGMGKYHRGDFSKEDADRLFGAEPEIAGAAQPTEALIDMTAGVSPRYLGNCVLEMKDMRLLTLLMSMGVALDYENSPFLVLAIDKGDTNAVAALLSRDASVNARDVRGRSALRAAVERGDRDLVSNLLAHEADPNTRDAKSATPMHVAAAKGDLEMVDNLIDHGARMDLADKEGRTPVDYAKRSPLGKKVADKFKIQSSEYARAKALIAEDKYDEAIAIYNQYTDARAIKATTIMKGAYLESEGRLTDALELYKQVDSADDIMRVSGSIREQEVKLTEARNNENAGRFEDAFFGYAYVGAIDDAAKVVARGVDISAKDGIGERALWSACSRDRMDIIRWLVDNDVDINAQVLSDSTPLIAAILAKRHRIYKYLIERGADVNAPSREGIGPLAYATVVNLDTVKYLVENGANVNAPGSVIPPLNMAALAGHLDIVKYLVDEGADVNATSINGVTAMKCAVSRGHQEIVEFLSRQSDPKSVNPESQMLTVSRVAKITEGGGYENEMQSQGSADISNSSGSRTTKLQTKAFIPSSPHYVGLISSGYRDLLTGDEIAWGSSPEQVERVFGPIFRDSGDLWDPDSNPNATTYIQTYRNRKMLERAFKYDSEGLFQVFAKYNARQIPDDEMLKIVVEQYGPADKEEESENTEWEWLDRFMWNVGLYPNAGRVSLSIRYTILYQPVGYLVVYFDIRSISRGRKNIY